MSTVKFSNQTQRWGCFASYIVDEGDFVLLVGRPVQPIITAVMIDRHGCREMSERRILVSQIVASTQP
eukprot:4807211-Pleurochrysis_carterae.AAC.1